MLEQSFRDPSEVKCTMRSTAHLPPTPPLHYLAYISEHLFAGGVFPLPTKYMVKHLCGGRALVVFPHMLDRHTFLSIYSQGGVFPLTNKYMVKHLCGGRYHGVAWAKNGDCHLIYKNVTIYRW